MHGVCGSVGNPSHPCLYIPGLPVEPRTLVTLGNVELRAEQVISVLNVESIRHLFVASLKKVFKNSKAFKRHDRIFRKAFSL